MYFCWGINLFYLIVNMEGLHLLLQLNICSQRKEDIQMGIIHWMGINVHLLVINRLWAYSKAGDLIAKLHYSSFLPRFTSTNKYFVLPSRSGLLTGLVPMSASWNCFGIQVSSCSPVSWPSLT